MMKIICATQIDKYKGDIWPTLYHVPRKGETVMMRDAMKADFSNRQLPTRLEVVDVTHGEKAIMVELHYRKIDIDIANQNGTNLF